MLKSRYVTGCEPNQIPVESPQEDAEQTVSGISGTTHSRTKTSVEEAQSRIALMRQSLKLEK